MSTFAVLALVAIGGVEATNQIIDFKVDQMTAPITVQSASPRYASRFSTRGRNEDTSACDSFRANL
jgi:hypothetical protein